MMASLRTPTEGNLDLKNPKGDWVGGGGGPALHAHHMTSPVPET